MLERNKSERRTKSYRRNFGDRYAKIQTIEREKWD